MDLLPISKQPLQNKLLIKPNTQTHFKKSETTKYQPINITGPLLNYNDLNLYIKKIYIIVSSYVLNEGLAFKILFESLSIINEIIVLDDHELPSYILNDVANNNHTLIFAIGVINIKNAEVLIPINDKCLIYQVEQQNILKFKNRDHAMKIFIKNFNNVIEFSILNNYYNKQPEIIMPLINYTSNIVNKDFDILFYGSESYRRKKILKYLYSLNKYKIHIAADIWGEELKNLINRSKIILNLHFIEDSNFETFRINLALSCNTHIISEGPTNKKEAYVYNIYENLINFVPSLSINENLNNLSFFIDNILRTDSTKSPDKIQKIEYINNQTKTIVLNNLFKTRFNENLFHKYFLKIAKVSNEINYSVIQNNSLKEFRERKYYAHLHCYDISKFNEIYKPYIDKISEYFSVIVTYSIGKNIINRTERFVILKIPNKGMDIGAKFCAIAFLNKENIHYEYVLFLHSKSNPETRRKYFEPLINNLDEEFIENINNYYGYFPDIEWEIVGDRLKRVSNNSEFKNHENTNLPERNLLYRNELLKYLYANNHTNRFIEGNCYILSKKVVDKLFTDPLIYNILNNETSFDYNWVCKAYNIKGDIYQVYKQFVENKLAPRNQNSFDGYLEHVFERVVLNFCDNYKILDFNLDKILDNDIAIIACYPNFLNTYFWVQNLIKECKFKKIYIIYSDLEENRLNNDLFDMKNLPYVEFIKIDNIGYDFGKYFYGMKLIKNKNEKFDKVWLINDSFIIDNITDMKRRYSFICNSKVAGCYISNEIKTHIQSYMLILDNDSFNYYFNQLNCYNFIDIKTINDKKNLILDLEVNLNNKYINNNHFNVLYNIEKYNENPALNEGYLNGIFKGQFVRNIYNKNILLERYHNESHLYIDFYKFIFTESIRKIYFQIYNKSKLINYHIPLFDDNIFEKFEIIKKLKIYNGNNKHIILLQQIFFNYKCNDFTSKENLKEKIYDIQKQSQNKKLVYTSNINQYDTFLDIDDKFIENDVDYIYVSNCFDADVCKNFKYIYSNIEGLDNFEINRMIKFDKTLYDCYEKVLYIDSNVTIHKKLGDFWNNLDNDLDLVLFSHPDRNTAIEEIHKLENTTENYNKWNLNSNKVNELCENFKGNLNNDLFWLNVQLSTTKMNIYKEIEEMYEKYKLKRDQVYFSLIKNKYKIKTIKIEHCKSDLLKFFQKSQIKHECIDDDYNYLVNWSDKFSRPFGGSHL